MVQCRGLKSSPYPLSSSLDALRVDEVVLHVGNILDAVGRDLLVSNRVKLWN